LGQSPSSNGAESGALLTGFTRGDDPLDPALATIIARWPTLPDDVRQAVLVAVETAG
jgi:hypothetical protein